MMAKGKFDRIAFLSVGLRYCGEVLSFSLRRLDPRTNSFFFFNS